MKTVAVIINRNAGRGRAAEIIQDAKRTLWGWPLEVLSPASVEELQNICGNLDPNKYEAAVVVGGDGTVHHALRGMARKPVPLCPFPGGTANDFATEQGITADWEQVQRLVDKKLWEPVDLIEANGVPFATVAGIGIGAVLTAELNDRRQKSLFFQQGLKRLKSELYTLLSAKAVLLRRDYIHNLHIRSNVFEEKIKTAAVFICNQKHLAGNLRVAHRSANDDQMFTVLIVPGTRTDQLIASLIKLKLGLLPMKDFIIFSTNQLTIQDLDNRPIRLFGDGETLIVDPHLQFRILPKGVCVYKERRRTPGGRR